MKIKKSRRRRKMRLFKIIVAIVMFFFAADMSFAASKNFKRLIMRIENAPSVEVVCQSYRNVGFIYLRVASTTKLSETSMDFLKKQVENMTSKIGHKTKLSGGYTLIYDGGYPIWEPYYHKDGDTLFACLLFTEDVRIRGKTLRAKGGDRKFPPWNYPYSKLATK